MDKETQILALVEEILDSNRSPDDACREHPELLPQVREQLKRFRSIEAQVEEVFPARNGHGDVPRPACDRAKLPEIPGYQLLELIGSGGVGLVYLARHIKLDRLVAIKMLLAGRYAGQRELERFKREAQTVAALRHPNIVQVYDTDEREGFAYLAMEYMEGGPLSVALDGAPQPARPAAQTIATLARAVHAAHLVCIVHRDLKPGNILMTSDGMLKIADFGLARRLDDSAGPTVTQPDSPLGTPSYMSPEQAIGRASEIGPASDIYSLGAILYEMLTGRPPFRGETAVETERQVMHDDPVPPSLLNPRTPRDLETICLKCLQKAPAQRYDTAFELAEDLDRFLTGLPILARPVGRMERGWRWMRRKPAHAAAWVGGLTALGAILAAVLWTLSQRAAIELAVSDDLAEVIRLEGKSDWRTARNTLERAKTRLAAAGGRGRLAARASQIEHELDVVKRLGEMRFSQGVSAEKTLDRQKWWQQYREVLSDAGLMVPGDTPEAVAARVAASPARTALVAAMDDMRLCTANRSDAEWLMRATRLADPDPWRDKVRDLATFGDADALAALAREAPVESQPATLLLWVAGPLTDSHPDDALALLRKVQGAHPSDFWANFALAEVLAFRKDPDAIGFYRAAISLQPDAAAAHVNLALAFKDIQNRPEEAIDSMSRAVALEPHSLVAQFDLAIWLLAENRPQEAIEHARLAAEVAPRDLRVHRVLGRALAMGGQYCEAADSFRRALELTPDDAKLQAFLARALKECETVSNKPSAPQEP